MRSRIRRTVAAVVVLAVIGSTTAATGRPDPYGAPGPLPGLSPATLHARFEATSREIVRARDTARRVGDGGRVKALSAFLSPGRRFLSFDARGHGRAVEVIGDLVHADRVAVVVPGADSTLTSYDSGKFVGGGSRALYDRAGGAGARLAVIAWLGYDTPSTLGPGVLTASRAGDGARGLRRLVGDLHRTNAHARFALLCHSYGSVVCAKAAHPLASLPVDEIALFGSPGTTKRDASDLGTPAHVWAGRAHGDWMGYVPNVRFLGVGFGADPVSRDFGAQIFDAGSGPHSGYLKPGSRALANLALIALGRDQEVTHA
ncbi:alpha/beta hydrolase [Actinomadura terrae]|uniref:alpha/beta hydrolase n=1 Tax=Actinomadura terrae TaxID=604353 RepID=UPI001FA6C8AD|nr:alpha/beta hydrolase [Actinomadura terrae]